MKDYKQRLKNEIAPSIRNFEEKYGHGKEGQSEEFELILDIFDIFNRPISLMETQLRPSVGMGVWQERWMLEKAVEDYLKECCREVDSYIEHFKKKPK